MAERVLHGEVLLFFARYLAVDIFGLSVMIVVIIARGRRSSELRARGRKRSVGREVSRRAKFGVPKRSRRYQYPPARVRNSLKVSRHPALVPARFVCLLGSFVRLCGARDGDCQKADLFAW